MKPIILCIMDGWGISNEINHNAIKIGNTPVFDELLRKYPNGVMQASGAHVGLPPGQMGNSEVGHMNLGAGRVVVQDLPRINEIIKNGLLIDNLALRKVAPTFVLSIALSARFPLNLPSQTELSPLCFFPDFSF